MLYEIVEPPGLFVAVDLVEHNDAEGRAWVSFHDTSRARTLERDRVTLRPMTVERWNAAAAEKFNPQAPHFESLAELERALRSAISRSLG